MKRTDYWRPDDPGFTVFYILRHFVVSDYTVYINSYLSILNQNKIIYVLSHSVHVVPSKHMFNYYIISSEIDDY